MRERGEGSADSWVGVVSFSAWMGNRESGCAVRVIGLGVRKGIFFYIDRRRVEIKCLNTTSSTSYPKLSCRGDTRKEIPVPTGRLVHPVAQDLSPGL